MSDIWLFLWENLWSPGVILGVFSGGYGVLIGILIKTKKFKAYFLLLNIIMLLVSGALLITGGVFIFSAGHGAEWYGFVSAGVLGFLITAGVWLVVNKLILSLSEIKKDGNN